MFAVVVDDRYMIVWGGYAEEDTLTYGDGGIYDMETDTWSPITQTSSSPAPRYGHKAYWTGESMILFGGQGYIDSPSFDNIYLPSAGGRFTP